MWFINNISKSKITSSVLPFVSFNIFTLFLPHNKLGRAGGVLIVPFHGALLLRATEINSINKITKLSFPISQFFAALSCIPLLKSVSLGSYRLDLEASGISLPPTCSLPLCPSLPTSPYFCSLHKRGTVVDRSPCSGCFLIMQVLYKENLGTGIPISITPEMQRVKQNQENLSSVFWKESEKKMPLNLIII